MEFGLFVSATAIVYDWFIIINDNNNYNRKCIIWYIAALNDSVYMNRNDLNNDSLSMRMKTHKLQSK